MVYRLILLVVAFFFFGGGVAEIFQMPHLILIFYGYNFIFPLVMDLESINLYGMLQILTKVLLVFVP